jgi:hypothetical protein
MISPEKDTGVLVGCCGKTRQEISASNSAGTIKIEGFFIKPSRIMVVRA